MSLKYKAGHIVALNSGGPRVTVVDGYKTGTIEIYTVCWFDNEKNLHREIVPEAALKNLGEYKPSA